MKTILMGFKLGVVKGFRYRGNVYSWVLADFSLYATLFLSYFLLFNQSETIGGYSLLQFQIYLSTYTIINNLFAVFFGEAISSYCQSIIDGTMYQHLLIPKQQYFSHVVLNFNVLPLISTPLLVIYNIILITQLAVPFRFILLYVIAIICATITMNMVFLTISTFIFLGWRVEGIQSIMVQLFSIAEKPETFFPSALRSIFVYIIPAFLFSAVPAKILIEAAITQQTLWLFITPILFIVIYRLFKQKALKKYQFEG